ncbi:hypothetical protein PR048_014551 [Dryococelus australis]|uniref:Uncharacterized protein n=1 Tax=Dryococelus australis TaxID=614101 RepID=A0ABQ9HEJ9_9NEOP|nr:hypothetical protein PR048_014551 [Dryococelus australis]
MWVGVALLERAVVGWAKSRAHVFSTCLLTGPPECTAPRDPGTVLGRGRNSVSTYSALTTETRLSHSSLIPSPRSRQTLVCRRARAIPQRARTSQRPAPNDDTASCSRSASVFALPMIAHCAPLAIKFIPSSRDGNDVGPFSVIAAQEVAPPPVVRIQTISLEYRVACARGKMGRDERRVSEEIWTTLNVSMEQRWNERAGKTGDPRENPQANGIVRHNSHMLNSGVARPVIEPRSALVGGEHANSSRLVVAAVVRVDPQGIAGGRSPRPALRGNESMTSSRSPCPQLLPSSLASNRGGSHSWTKDKFPPVSSSTHVPMNCLFRRATVAERLACSPPTTAIRVQSPAGSLRIFACGIRAGRCRWWAGFLGDFPFPPPFHSGAARYSPKSQSSALKTSKPGERLLRNSLAVSHTLHARVARTYRCEHARSSSEDDNDVKLRGG